MQSKFITILLLLAGAFSSIWAQKSDLEGTWKVEGANPNEVSYEGTLEIEALNNTLHKLQWDVRYENKSSSEVFPGTGIYDKQSNRMYAAYGINTLRYGLIQYPLNEKGGLEGSGSWTSHQGVGAELIGGKLKRGKIEGTYEVVGRRSLGDVALGASETYSGTLKIKKEGNIYRLSWYLGDGTPYQGFAYKKRGNLIGVWGIGGSYGLEIYTFDADMQEANATWTTPNYDYEEGEETIMKQ